MAKFAGYPHLQRWAGDDPCAESHPAGAGSKRLWGARW